MPTEIIVSLVGLLGIVAGAVLNAWVARRKDLAEIEKLRAETAKAHAEADKTRLEAFKHVPLANYDDLEMSIETAEEFARSLAAILSRYLLMEFLARLNLPFKNRAKEKSLMELETFLSLNRKALYAHISVLADTTPLAGTSFEYRDLLRAAIYNLDFINRLRKNLEEVVHQQAAGTPRIDFNRLVAEIENSLLRAFERSLANPRLALLSSWEGEKFVQKYDL